MQILGKEFLKSKKATMENNTQIQNSKRQEILSNISQTFTAQMLVKNDHEKIEKSVGIAVADLLDRPPIAMLKKVIEPIAIERFLAIQIQKLSASLNLTVGGNMTPQQIPMAAKELMVQFPAESVEDFVLCFRRGSIGYFGTIYNRLDLSVLSEWMRKYLDEKYVFVEAEVARQKTEGVQQNEINYAAYKARVAEEKKDDHRENILNDAEYIKRRAENPYKYFTVKNIQILATSQQHAENIVQKMIDNGELEEVPNEEAH